MKTYDAKYKESDVKIKLIHTPKGSNIYKEFESYVYDKRKEIDLKRENHIWK